MWIAKSELIDSPLFTCRIMESSRSRRKRWRGRWANLVTVVLSLTVAHGGGVVVVDDGLLWRKTIITVVFPFCAKAHISSFSFFFCCFSFCSSSPLFSWSLPLNFSFLPFLFLHLFSHVFPSLFFSSVFLPLPHSLFFLKIKKNLCFLSSLFSHSFLCFSPKIYLPFLPLYCRLPSPFIFCVSPPFVFD